MRVVSTRTVYENRWMRVQRKRSAKRSRATVATGASPSARSP
jgi:hypothetical protein